MPYRTMLCGFNLEICVKKVQEARLSVFIVFELLYLCLFLMIFSMFGDRNQETVFLSHKSKSATSQLVVLIMLTYEPFFNRRCRFTPYIYVWQCVYDCVWANSYPWY